MKRQRGRNRRNNNNNNNNHHNSNRSMDSNGPDVKVRGNAKQIYDKYITLARDAASGGSRVKAENYLQHAEHYLRIYNKQEALKQAAREEAEAAREANAENNSDDQNGDEGSGRKNNKPRRQREPKADKADKASKETEGLEVVTPEADAPQGEAEAGVKPEDDAAQDAPKTARRRKAPARKKPAEDASEVTPEAVE